MSKGRGEMVHGWQEVGKASKQETRYIGSGIAGLEGYHTNQWTG